VALDLDPGIARRIGRGGLEALTPEERAALPIGPVLETDARRFLDAHESELPDDPDRPERMRRAMAARDDVMADAIVRHLESPAGRGRRMVVLVGSGHVRDGLGVPPRVARRRVGPQLVVVPVEVRAAARDVDWRPLVAGDVADYVLITPEERRP
jgi:uncharacterized iron-regulated protein